MNDFRHSRDRTFTLYKSFGYTKYEMFGKRKNVGIDAIFNCSWIISSHEWHSWYVWSINRLRTVVRHRMFQAKNTDFAHSYSQRRHIIHDYRALLIVFDSIPIVSMNVARIHATTCCLIIINSGNFRQWEQFIWLYCDPKHCWQSNKNMSVYLNLNLIARRKCQLQTECHGDIHSMRQFVCLLILFLPLYNMSFTFFV